MCSCSCSVKQSWCIILSQIQLLLYPCAPSFPKTLEAAINILTLRANKHNPGNKKHRLTCSIYWHFVNAWSPLLTLNVSDVVQMEDGTFTLGVKFSKLYLLVPGCQGFHPESTFMTTGDEFLFPHQPQQCSTARGKNTHCRDLIEPGFEVWIWHNQTRATSWCCF